MSRRKQHKMSATFGWDAWAWRRIDRSLAIIQAAVVNWLTAIADTLPQLIKTWNTWAATFAAATQIVQGPDPVAGLVVYCALAALVCGLAALSERRHV